MSASTWESRGEVTVATAGTPVPATQNNGNPSASDYVAAIMFQQVPGNTGAILVKDADGGVLARLPAPSTNTIPSAVLSRGGSGTPDLFDVSQYQVDAAVNGEKCLVSVVKARWGLYGA